MANVHAVPVAAVMRKSVRPKKGLNIALGIISGAVSGPGLGFFIEVTGQGLSIPECGKRHLGLPVFGPVPDKEKE
jgi:capsular polysaccharide biosynthesis protein